MTERPQHWPFEPDWPAHPGSEVVYGVLPSDGHLVLVPREQADRLAVIHAAIHDSKTWEEFRSNVPDDAWREVLEAFEEQGPEPAEPFEADALPGYADGDWPDWPAQRMLNWMPVRIRERFGRVRDSVLNGPYLELDPERKEDIVAALETEGFRATEDADLVARASGH